MNNGTDPRLIKRLTIFASAASIVPGLIGVSVLAGWTFPSIALLNWGAATPMAPNAAFCTVLASVSLWLLRKKDLRPFGAIKRIAANAAAGIAILVGLFSVAEHLFDRSFGLDRLLLVRPLVPQVSAARVLMSPVAAGFFVLFGWALMAIDWKTRRGGWPTQFLSIGAMIGAAFGVLSLFLGPGVSRMTLAVPAVVSYFLLSSALLCSRPTWALRGLLVKHSQGATLLRKTLPAALLVLSLVGFSISRALLTESHFTWVEVSILAVICAVALSAFVLWVAFLIERGDAERKKLEAVSNISRDQLDRLLDRIEEPQDEKLLRRRANVGFAVAVLLTVLLSALSWRVSQQAADDAEWVAHTRQVTATLEFTLRHLDDVETGARGFTLTGLEAFLEPFEAGRLAVGEDLQALRHLTVDNRDQQQRLSLLAQQANTRVDSSSDLVAFRRSSGTIPSVLQLEHGKKLMDAARSTVQVMEAAENRLLEDRIQRARVGRRFNTTAIGLGSVLGVIFLSWAGMAVSSEIGVSARARAHLNALNTDLERRVEQRTTALQAEIATRISTDAKLRASEGRLAGIIASAMDSIITVDDEQRIVLFNCAAEKMFQCPAEDAMGQPLTKFIPARFHTGHAEHIRRYGKTGVTNRVMGPKDILWALRADGQEFQIEASISYVLTGGKQLFTVILRDVTERKRSEEIRERLAAVVDFSDDAIISKDLNGTINAWNRGAEKVFGYSSAEALGKPLRMLFPPDRLKEEVDILARIQKGESVEHFETERLRKGGAKIIVSVTISPIRDAKGAVVGASKIARDITERTAKEEALRESEDRFRLFIEHAPAALAMFDRDMKYLHESRRWRSDFGLGDREIRGICHYEIFPEVPERWKEIHRRALAGEVLRSENDRFERPDGHVQWLRWEVRPWLDRSGQIGGIVVVSEDVTERNRSQEALVDSEERLRLAIDGARLGTWHWKIDSDVLEGSAQSFALFGLPADTRFTFVRFLAALHPDDRARVDDAMKRALSGESEYDVEYRAVWLDGTLRWIAAKGTVYKNAVGENTHMGGILFDVTERHRAEDALRESEERFQAMANGIPQLAWIAKADGHIVWYNQRWYEYTGTTSEQMEGWGWQSVHDPEMLPKVMEKWKGAIATGQPFEMEFPLRGVDGNFCTFLTRVMPLMNAEGSVIRWFGTNTDISERKRAEQRMEELARELRDRAEELSHSQETLEKQTAMFKLVLASMGEGLIAADREGRFLIFNDAAHNLMGRGPDDVPKEQWTQHYQVFLPDGITPYPPESLPLVRALQGESLQVELIVQHPEDLSGSSLEVTARPLKDAGGNLCGGVAVLRDITERKRNEVELARRAEELNRSRQNLETQTLMLQSVLDSVVEGLVVADEHGKFVIWNPAAKRIVGLDAANLSPEEWSLHYGAYLPDTLTPLPSEQDPLLRAIRGEASSAEIFFRNPELQGGVWVESSGAPLRDKNGTLRGGVVAFRDITQKKAAEREIRKLNENLEFRIAERTAQLEAANYELESFSYSVSHDLRAPIRHISSFSKILSEEFGASMDPEARRLLERIDNGTRRMTLLVDGLLSLARLGPQCLKLSVTELNAVVDGVLSILQPQCEGRDVEWRIAKLPALECDPILMGQVFQNLIGNALKYSGRRMKAVIEVASIREVGKPLVIFVRDNGAGFSMQYADKLFGVFQRMHKDSEFEGTGVGLATAQRIIQKHGGSIWAEAEVDRGATFYFTVGQKASMETMHGTDKNGALQQVREA